MRIALIVIALIAPAPATAVDWKQRQIYYANLIARNAVKKNLADPWPRCPNPYFERGATWQDTVNCENSGRWLDSPGFFRCGLQFHPMWERYYGQRFCP